VPYPALLWAQRGNKVNTGVAAQMEYAKAKSEQVGTLVEGVTGIQTSLMKGDLSRLPAFRAQLDAMAALTSALQRVFPMADPRVAFDLRAIDDVISKGAAWAASYDTFGATLWPNQETPPEFQSMTQIVVATVNAALNFCVRLSVSNVATVATTARMVDSRAVTTALLEEMGTAYENAANLAAGREAAREVLMKRAALSLASTAGRMRGDPLVGAVAGPEVMVRRYKDQKDYERDARELLAAGWSIEAQSTQQGNVKMGPPWSRRGFSCLGL